MAEEIEPFPEAGRLGRIARVGVDAGVAAVPAVGGSLEVLIAAVIAPSLERRRTAWFRTLGEVVAELQERIDGFDPEQLAGDEVFVSGVIEASRIAMGAHREDKLRILKTCLVHLALSEHSDDLIELRLLGFVDMLSPEHFLVLRYLSNPKGWYEKKGIQPPNFMSGAPQAVMREAQLPIAAPVLELVIRDLGDRGLANTQSIGVVMDGDGAWQPLASGVGLMLLRFVDGAGGWYGPRSAIRATVRSPPAGRPATSTRRASGGRCGAVRSTSKGSMAGSRAGQAKTVVPYPQSESCGARVRARGGDRLVARTSRSHT